MGGGWNWPRNRTRGRLLESYIKHSDSITRLLVTVICQSMQHFELN